MGEKEAFKLLVASEKFRKGGPDREKKMGAVSRSKWVSKSGQASSS